MKIAKKIRVKALENSTGNDNLPKAQWRKLTVAKLYFLMSLLFMVSSVLFVWFIERQTSTLVQVLEAEQLWLATTERLEMAVAPSPKQSDNLMLLQKLHQNHRNTIAVQSASVSRLSRLGVRVSWVAVLMIVLLWVFGLRVASLQTQSEQQRIQMLKASRLSALGKMAGEIAHEINNPLNFIQGYAETIDSLVSKQPIAVEKIKKSVTIIQQTVNRVAEIIKGLRKLSRNATDDPFALVPVQKIVLDIIDLCQQKVKKMNIDLIAQTSAEHASILCREVQIGQVLLNLIGNSADAIAKQEEKWIRIAIDEKDSHVEISVTDSGPGIPREIRARMLTPFFTTKPAGEGTGLGLSISKEIVELHGGMLKLDESCKNTRFVITLPKKHGEIALAA
ncbi:MAG: GHKL domain-containing protein [Deltaproteobacteria bacterium]|nr:GHKL domain-containing protein [Deltaproteobacteria bacterium]